MVRVGHDMRNRSIWVVIVAVRGHLPRCNVVHVATEVVLAATAAAEAVVGPDTVVVARLTLELRLYPEKLNLRVGIAILH